MAEGTAIRPARNRRGDWIIYHRRTGAVEEHAPEEARRRLDAGTHVVRPGASPRDWDPGPQEAQWTLGMSPESYLERYPDGPNAGLARAVLGQGTPGAAPEPEDTPGTPEDAPAAGDDGEG